MMTDRVTVVLGYVELLLDGAFGPVEPRQRKILLELKQAAAEMAEMVRKPK